ncbi:MAG: hypothetical protein LBV61_11240 [Burkholderiaceae bacterium]|jgi:hypothetical protein|nr:hypothetical protein [Burkholderiaceae bacterium]
MKKTIAAFIVAVLLFGYIGSAAYAVSAQGIEQLLICADHGGLKIPFSKHICRNYFFAFRGSRKDIDTLEQGIGALFVVQGKSTVSERSELLKFLVDKGLDVNRAGVSQLPPLHGAVLANSEDEIQMLLNNGANLSLKDSHLGLTPLGFALKLQNEDKSRRDRNAVIALLKNAQAVISSDLPR